MFFVNLSFAEFLAVFSAISALVVTLYLLNRARRKQTVATLKFWVQAAVPISARQRRRIQQPWSLLLQLLSLALLLLAIAQLRWGSPRQSSRDHVLVLDTSSWMGARSGRGTLLDEAKKAARGYIRALPSSDRVMVVRADGLATPVTGLESNRRVVDAAIGASRPGADALNLEQALSFATQVQRLHTQRMGEVVLISGGRVLEEESGFQPPADVPLRVLPVSQVTENCGLRKIGLRRSDKDPAVWDVFVSVRNYGALPRTVPVALQYGGAPMASRILQLGPGKEEEVTFAFRTRAAGWLEARLLLEDALPDDNRAVLELPALKTLQVAVYTDAPDLLRPVLAANPQVQALYRLPSEYDPAVGAQIVIFDGFRPAQMPAAGVICIQPPANQSPVKLRTSVRAAPIIRWRTDHALGVGLRTKELRLNEADVYSLSPGDISVAEVEAGPVILARPGPPRLVMLGFHPGKSDLRNELATPLLFANILGWLEPESFRHWELNAGTTGAVTVPLETELDPGKVRVISDTQQQLPFTLKGKSLRFFAGSPGVIRVITEGRERVYSLTLPEVGDAVWKTPVSVRQGIPSSVQEAIARDLWRWLAALGGLGLLIEWLLFGKTSPASATSSPPSLGRTWRKAS